MKNFITVLIFALLPTTYAFAGSHPQIQAVLQLNDLCGDAWCESSVDFNFKKLDCSFEREECLLEFTAQENYSVDQPVLSGHCVMTGIASSEQLFDFVNSAQTAEPIYFLKSSFLEQVNSCLADYIK